MLESEKNASSSSMLLLLSVLCIANFGIISIELSDGDGIAPNAIESIDFY